MDKEHEAAFRRLCPGLVERTRKATRYAVSWRNFSVACMVLAWSDHWYHDDGLTLRTFVGVNLKPLEGGPKICAEQAAIGSAVAEGAQQIIAVIVVGEPQPDSISGHESPTLHPCWQCRELMRRLPQVLPDTIVYTVCNGNGSAEEHTFAELVQLHETKKR